MSTNLSLKAIVPVVAAVFSLPAAAGLGCDLPGGNFALSLQVGGSCGAPVTSTTADAFIDLLQPVELQTLNPAYSDVALAIARGRFNGVSMEMTYAAGSADVILEIPALGYSKLFSGATREESIELLREDLKRGDILGRIMKAQAQSSPTSPITGVGGLIPSVVATEFNQNFTAAATQIAAPPAAAQAASQQGATPNLVGVGLQYGSYDSRDSLGFTNRIEVVTLPLSYTLRNNIDPRRQLSISLPITQVDVNGAKVYSAGLGLAYRFPMNDQWTLVPSARISGVGSIDLATVSGVHTVSLTSVYMWEAGPFTMAMGNMLAHNGTMKFRSGDYAFDPDISNTSMRNGLMLSQPVEWGGQRLSLEYSLVDTRYLSGVRPYLRQFQEFGITVGTNKNAFSARSFLRGGLTFTTGKGTRGWQANIGYWF